MAHRATLVCVAVLCAALSAAVVAGDAVEPQGLIVEASGQGKYLADVQGGRKLLVQSEPGYAPGWVSHDGKVFAFQGHFISGNLGDKGDQQGNSAAANNGQVAKHSGSNGAVWQTNSISKSVRKLLSSVNSVFTKDGKVYVVQGNIGKGNTVQDGTGNQQDSSTAVNNAQSNKDSHGNGVVSHSNSNSGRK